MSLIDRYDEQGPAGDSDRPTVPRGRRLHAARQFVAKNMGRSDLTPAVVAQALGISVRQLHLLFAPTGEPSLRHLLRRPPERARRYLTSEPDRKVVDIAYACGIKSTTVFYRGFRAVLGTNPNEYRRSAQGTDPSPQS